MILASTGVSADGLSRESILEALRENPYRAAAGHCPYEAPVFHDTPAPRGYRPVYVSHYSRHGSRYQGGRESFEAVLPALDSMSAAGLLTPCGDSLMYELQLMYEAHDDNEGLLTGRGADEQRQIAGRLYARVPKLFRQKKARAVVGVSSPAVRCLQSMANFMTALKGESPKLEPEYLTGSAKMLHHIAPRVSGEYRQFVRSCYEPLQDSLLRISQAPSAAAGRLFTEVSAISAFTGGRDVNRFVYDLFVAAQGAACLDIAVDPLRFFSASELYDFLEIRNLYFCANYGPLAPTMEMRAEVIRPLARTIVTDADAALAGNGRCADFRFGHDGGAGPLLLILGIDGFDRPVDPSSCLSCWQAWKYMPMCSNLQMIFYRNRKGDVLVKFIRNEMETSIPALEPVEGVYYRWQDVRRHILKRTGDYKELPAYYKEYLDVKAEEIAALRKEESGGFFFWTDTHFPDNSGNAAAVLEYLQGKTGPCIKFFGGDAALNAETLEGGMQAYTASLLQAGLYGRLYPLRGNHDFVASTHVVGSENLGSVATQAYLCRHRSADAVTDAGSPVASYYYVDDPSARIRYVAVETTDEVRNGKIVYNVSSRQLRWMRDVAAGSLPRGWSLFVLSHVPLNADHTTCPSLLAAGESLSSDGLLRSGYETDVLMFLCGHRHSDITSSDGSRFHVITAADCLVDMGKVGVPYSLDAGKKIPGTTNEQTMDYVSVSKDHSIIRMKRIGYGYDRVFHVRPYEVEVGKGQDLASLLDDTSVAGQVIWTVYDTDGNRVVRNSENERRYEVASVNSSVTPEGHFTMHRPGSVIAAALHPSGTQEFFILSTLK